MTSPTTLALALLAAALATGCASQGAGTPAKPPTAFGCPVASRGDTSLEDLIEAKVQPAGGLRDVAVQSITCSQRHDALRIDVELRNDSAEVRRVAYRFRWLDRDGLPAWEEEALKPVLIYPRAAQQLVGLAPTAQAVDFRLVLMPQDQ